MRRKLLPWAACALLPALLTLLWSLHHPPSPAAGFWRPPCPLQSLWNHELEEHRLRGAARMSGRGCRPDPQVEARIPDYQWLPQPMKDFLVYRHCRRFPLLLEPRGVCGPARGRGRGPDLRLLLAVKSQASSFGRRQAIRQTWGGLGRASGVGLVFLLGQQQEADGHPGLAGLLACENRRFGDLLQWAFRDTFLNLTLKEVLFLPWLSRRCPGARFVFKGDDDVFVNTERLLDYLSGLGRSRSPDLYLGDAIVGARPCRDATLKYYVPGSFYSGLYPPYAGGAGVVYTSRLARRLERASRALPLFPIDDVFAGMCLRSLGLAPTPHTGFHSFGINDSQRWEPCAYHQLFLVHRRSPQEMVLLWRMLHQGNLTCG